MPEFYNGAIDFQPVEADDQRPKIDAACGPGCASAWKSYLSCGDRIEAKVLGSYTTHGTAHAALHTGLFHCHPLLLSARPQGSGDCSSWYMDYQQCLDQCAAKSLFKQLS